MNTEVATTQCENTINRLRIYSVFSYQDALKGTAALWTTLKETPTNTDPKKKSRYNKTNPRIEYPKMK